MGSVRLAFSGICVASGIIILLRWTIWMAHSTELPNRRPKRALNNSLIGYLGEQTIISCPIPDSSPGWTGPPDSTTYKYTGRPNLNPILDRVCLGDNGSLIINSTNFADVGVYICYGSGVAGYATIHLVVHGKPRGPFIENTESGNNTVHGIENQLFTFICQSTGGYPAPTLTWLRASLVLKRSTDSDVSKQADGTFSVTLQYSIIADRIYDWSKFTCKLDHPAFASPTETYITLVLSLKPSFPILSTNTNITEGQVVSFQCIVHNCRPPANLTLLLDNNTLTSSVESQYDPIHRTYTVNATSEKLMKREDNGKTIHCSVSHEALMDSLQTTSVLHVLFGPEYAEMSGNKQLIADGNNKLTLTCKTAANPAATIKWEVDGSKVNNNNPVDKTAGEYDGIQTRQDLVLTPSRDMDGVKVQCFAFNGVSKDPVNSSVTLDFLYAVYGLKVNGPLVHALNGDEIVTLHCEAKSKPAALLKWYKDPEPNAIVQSQGEGTNTSLELVVRKISPDDAGSYGCVASNGIGASLQEKVELVVKCVPAPPENVRVHNITTSSLTVSWNRGPDCGLPQNFVVQYSKDAKVWKSAFDITDENTDRTASFDVTITQLEGNSKYYIRINGQNREGIGHYSSLISFSTTTSPDAEEISQDRSGMIAGISVGALIAIVFIATFIVMLRRYKIKLTFTSKGQKHCKFDNQTNSKQDQENNPVVFYSNVKETNSERSDDKTYCNLQLDGQDQSRHYETLQTTNDRQMENAYTDLSQ